MKINKFFCLMPCSIVALGAVFYALHVSFVANIMLIISTSFFVASAVFGAVGSFLVTASVFLINCIMHVLSNNNEYFGISNAWCLLNLSCSCIAWFVYMDYKNFKALGMIKITKSDAKVSKLEVISALEVIRQEMLGITRGIIHHKLFSSIVARDQAISDITLKTTKEQNNEILDRGEKLAVELTKMIDLSSLKEKTEDKEG